MQLVSAPGVVLDIVGLSPLPTAFFIIQTGMQCQEKESLMGYHGVRHRTLTLHSLVRIQLAQLSREAEKK